MEIWIFEDSEQSRKVFKQLLFKILGDQLTIKEAESMDQANALLEKPGMTVNIVFIDGNLSPVITKKGEEGRILERKTRSLYPTALIIDISLYGNALENPDFRCPKDSRLSEKEVVIRQAVEVATLKG